jgi:hypothetical protein
MGETLETCLDMSPTASVADILYAARALLRSEVIANALLMLPCTCCKLLLVRRSNNVLACIGLRQHARRVGKPLHQTPVEETSGDE